MRRRLIAAGLALAAALGVVVTQAPPAHAAVVRWVYITGDIASEGRTCLGTTGDGCTLNGSSGHDDEVAAGIQANFNLDTTKASRLILAGDNQYEDGTLSEYRADFDQSDSYGPLQLLKSGAFVKPTLGNHEWHDTDANSDGVPDGFQGYFSNVGGLNNYTGNSYFSNLGTTCGNTAGANCSRRYSFTLNGWTFLVIDSVDGAGQSGGADEAWYNDTATWIQNNTPTTAGSCALAVWHHPRWNDGSHGNDAGVGILWRSAFDNGVDVVVNAHDHNYQRFAKTARGTATASANGMREFVVGSGGTDEMYAQDGTPNATLETFIGYTPGFFRFAAYDDGTYTAKFFDANDATGTAIDTVTDSCVNDRHL